VSGRNLTDDRYDIAGAVAEARHEVERSDGKAGTLLTLTTGALAGLLTFAHAGHVRPPAAVLLWLATALTTTALAVLLTVIRPRLAAPRGEMGGMLGDHEQFLACTPDRADEWNVARLRMFSALAVAKHRRIRLAVDLLFAALAALAIAAITITI
jgi:hypothetical protein